MHEPRREPFLNYIRTDYDFVFGIDDGISFISDALAANIIKKYVS